MKEFEKIEDFYQVYNKHRTYVKSEVRRKHLRRFDKKIWLPSGMTAQHSVLELGCGTGLFLAYLEAKGVAKFTGMTVTRKAGTLCQLV